MTVEVKPVFVMGFKLLRKDEEYAENTSRLLGCMYCQTGNAFNGNVDWYLVVKTNPDSVDNLHIAIKELKELKQKIIDNNINAEHIETVRSSYLMF